MRAIIQRTNSKAKVRVNNTVVGAIDFGLIVYLGVGKEDTKDDIIWLANKIINLRIFNDENDKMNISLQSLGGSMLLISQFTLYADVKKGNRPSYIRSADPEYANKLYTDFGDIIVAEYGINVERGEFGAHMEVEYTNDGPVTIIIDSKQRSF